MFNPLEDLFAAVDATGVALVLEDPTLLGEVGGVLYGSHQRESYLRDGGAIYPVPQLLNHAVVGYEDKAAFGSFWQLQGGGSRAAWMKKCGLLAPARVLEKVLRAATFVFPALRVLFPYAVPRWDAVSRDYAALASRPRIHRTEHITALCFHPYLMILAMAMDEGGADGRARVVIYDLTKHRSLAVLTNAFQKEVHVLAWKPLSKEVLAVGCRGGVLLWTLNGCIGAQTGGGAGQVIGSGSNGMAFAMACSTPANSSSAAAANDKAVPHALFYPCMRATPVTAMSFSTADGRYLACGSNAHTHLKLLDLSYGPHEACSNACSVVPSIDGGVESLVFAMDDSYIISSVHAASIVCVTNVKPTAFGTAWVATPAPVQAIANATGVGVHYYFLCSHCTEGVLLAKVNAFVGIEVVSVISTGICRGVGGNVRAMACSKRRLWMALETGHLLICHYGVSEGAVTVCPIGVAAMEVSHLASFDGCVNGSLLAVVEWADSVCFVPSYHV